MNKGIIKSYGQSLIEKELLVIIHEMSTNNENITSESIKNKNDSYTLSEIANALEVFKTIK